MTSIMFSISVLFSCSLKNEEKHAEEKSDTPPSSPHTAVVSTLLNYSYLCNLLLYSLQLCAFLSHCLCLLHLIQFLAVFNTDTQAQCHIHQGTQ